jgi:hypothetical protein
MTYDAVRRRGVPTSLRRSGESRRIATNRRNALWPHSEEPTMATRQDAGKIRGRDGDIMRRKASVVALRME